MNKKLYYSLLTFSSLVLVGGTVSSSLINVNKNTYSNEKIFKGVESNILKENNDVRKNFEYKFSNTYIEKRSVKGVVGVNIDSYQQSNKLEHSNPTLTYNYKFRTSINVSNVEKFNSINNVESFTKKLNSNIWNTWTYNVSSWWAKAGKRFMGVNIVMPHWAPEVNENHGAKTYGYWSSNQIEKACSFIYDDLVNFLFYLLDHRSDIHIDNNIKEIIKKITSKTSFKTKLRPIIKNIKNAKIKNINFGNIKAKIIDEYDAEIYANHMLPIIDYTTKWECSGPKCSHNIRNLLDVVMTSLVDLVKFTFGSSESYVSQIIEIVVYGLLLDLLSNLFKDNKISNNLYILICDLINYAAGSGFFHRALKYINDNLADILFNFTGRVVKHGIQLGKCGHLMSGVKIDRNENISKISSESPLILFNINAHSIFKNRKNFDLNSLECIIELSNYQKLYNYLEVQDFNNEIKNILLFNIKNLTSSSEDVYNSYLKYIDNNIEPTRYNTKLESFKKFEKNGWIIPSDINQWNILNDYIIPSYLSENIVENQNSGTQSNFDIFYNNYEFLSENPNLNLDYNNFHSKREEYEPENYLR